MKPIGHHQQESDHPTGLSNSARRALVGAGYVELEQLTSVTEAGALRLHGMGPKALELLRQALAARGMAFAKRQHTLAREEQG